MSFLFTQVVDGYCGYGNVFDLHCFQGYSSYGTRLRNEKT